MLVAAPASAQTSMTGAFTERPGEALSRNLRSLAANPKSVAALMGAGKAALDLGDPQAALTFFARAEEQMPRDGRVKMWIGSALIQLQQPHAALKFFRDATDLGVGEAEVARDRGLAFDVAGRPRDAQRDYRLVLQRGRDDEVTRRLALSLAISGEREPALRLLEDQLLVRDPAAERTRALVLALTGDSAGAARAVRAAMPGPQASAMTPFLNRLPSLSPAERALAVHLGIFPGDGRTAAPTTFAANDFAAAVTDAGRPDARQSSLARRSPAPEPVSTAPRRRPGTEEAVAPATRRVASRLATTSGSDDIPSLQTRRQSEAPPTSAEVEPVRSEARREPVSLAAAVRGAAPPPQAEPPAIPIVDAPAMPLQLQLEPPPAEVRLAAAEPPPPQAEAAPGGSRLADLSATVANIAEPEPAPARARPAKPKPAARAATTASAAAKPPAKAKPTPPAEPSRSWVQISSAAQKDVLPREFARLRAKAPKLLGGRTAWTTPVSATNRLLVGPFPDAKAARAFVSQLKAAELSAFALTSAAGQKVEKLPAR